MEFTATEHIASQGSHHRRPAQVPLCTNHKGSFRCLCRRFLPFQPPRGIPPASHSTFSQPRGSKTVAPSIGAVAGVRRGHTSASSSDSPLHKLQG